ncbi:MAG: UDP-N-acetylglucosamine 1-carboxyvinyltransferase, partial [Kiritimatiellae bacterium]|nr:UDP-N-acetylglucosamine 1-carboxyvinyltransferase [Kiritimatiellia bacterium]
MSRFVIEGGYPLSGAHRAPGNKNAALPMIAASLLADGPVVMSNLPLIRDVRRMLELVAETGASVDLDEKARRVSIDPRTCSKTELPEALCGEVRTSILLAGPLLARFGRAVIPPPGGDVIGRRRLDTHFDGLSALGATVSQGKAYEMKAPDGLRGAGRMMLDEASVTATENILMAAAAAPGRTVIFNAACEPHVANLCKALCAMGAEISGIGTNRLVVDGVSALHGAEVEVEPDYIAAGSYLAAAAATGGSLTLENAGGDEFAVMRRAFARLGVHWQIAGDRLLYPGAGVGGLKIEPEWSGAIPKIEDGIWPAVPSDLLSALIVLATQSEGLVLFYEKHFEQRLYF